MTALKLECDQCEREIPSKEVYSIEGDIVICCECKQVTQDDRLFEAILRQWEG